MNWQPLGKEIKILVTQFMDAMDQIVITRLNEYRAAQAIENNRECIRIRMIYSPKQRVLWDLINKSQSIQIPVISFWLTGFSRDQSRVFNKIDGSYYNIYPAASGAEHLLQPLPVNITMNCSIITRYQTDMDQILGQLAYFDPYIVVSWHDPLLDFTEVRSEIFWSESVNINYPIEQNSSESTRIIADTTFTMKGWLYKKPQPNIGKIYKIITTYTSVSEIESAYSALTNLTDLRTEYNSDVQVISGRPFLTKTYPTFTLTGLNTEFILFGDMFNWKEYCVSGLFAIPLDYGIYDNVSVFDPLSGQPSLTAKYPAFSAVPITNYTIENNNTLTFILPSAKGYGSVDILAWNEAGYSRLSEGRKPQLNPWTEEISAREYYQDTNDQSVLGIKIKPLPLTGGIGVYQVGSTFIIS